MIAIGETILTSFSPCFNLHLTLILGHLEKEEGNGGRVKSGISLLMKFFELRHMCSLGRAERRLHIRPHIFKPENETV